MPDKKLTLRVNGQDFDDWTDCTIRLSMRTMSGSFRVAVVEKEAPFVPNRQLTFYRGNPCEILLNGKRIMTGFIDSRELSYDAGSHTLGFSGRDKTCDLVDCCYTGKQTQFKNATVLTICKTLAAQHDIPVIANTDVGKPLREFLVDPTQTIANQIAQACAYRALLPLSYGDGKLYLDVLSNRKAHDKLALGLNIAAMNANQDSTDRFSVYYVRAQAQMEDNPKTPTDESQKTYTKASAKAFDSEVARYRPQVMLLDGDCTQADCLKRAQWEAWTRNGASREFTYTVQGWHQSNGDLWLPNTLVDVADPWAWLDQEMVIIDVEYTLSEDSGSTTTMTIGHPYVFVRNSEKEPDVGKEERKTTKGRKGASMEEKLRSVATSAFVAAKAAAGREFTETESLAWWEKNFYAKVRALNNSGTPAAPAAKGGRAKGVPK